MGAGSDSVGEGEGDEKRAFPNGRLPPSKRPFAPCTAQRPFAPCEFERPFDGLGRRGAGEMDGASPKRPGLEKAVATADDPSPKKAEFEEEGHGEGEGGGWGASQFGTGGTPGMSEKEGSEDRGLSCCC